MQTHTDCAGPNINIDVALGGADPDQSVLIVSW